MVKLMQIKKIEGTDYCPTKGQCYFILEVYVSGYKKTVGVEYFDSGNNAEYETFIHQLGRLGEEEPELSDDDLFLIHEALSSNEDKINDGSAFVLNHNNFSTMPITFTKILEAK